MSMIQSSMKKIAKNLMLAGSLLVMGMIQESLATTPPPHKAIDQYKADGSYTKRLSEVLKRGNDKFDPALVYRSQLRLYELQGLPLPERLMASPPDLAGSLPTKGAPRMLAILVDFSDQPAQAGQTVEAIQLKMFGDGNVADYPYESLRNFYQRSSYGQLNVSGNVLGWYRAKGPRSQYADLGWEQGYGNLVKEAVNHYKAQGHDFAQYDSDNDGYIDALFIKWTGPDDGWGSFWWAYQSYMVDTNYMVDGKKINKFVWSWYAYVNGNQTVYNPQIDIHETGHLLGLPDYYDYESTNGGLGGLDMMDANWGDHNSFSKFMLDWIKPTVISSGSQTKTLNPSGTSPEAVLIMPNVPENNIFGEYFMAQYRKRGSGNDPSGTFYPDYPGGSYPTDGLVIWHVDARLNAEGTDFEYSNTKGFQVHKQLRLMEADGLEEIEQNKTANAGDFYLPPSTFTPLTTPNSADFSGQSTQIYINNLSQAGTAMTASFSVGGPYTLTAVKRGTGSGVITGARINCGSDCTESYASITSVTLNAVATTGSTFAGWSEACSGTGVCTVKVDGAKTVMANFTGGEMATAVEFYHAGKEHYFNTANTGDIAFLEANPQSGWAKTGYTFKVYPLDSEPSGTVAVARYYGALQQDKHTFKPDSHFYTGSAGERQILDDGYRKACPQNQGSCTGEAWYYEKDEYRVYLPSGSSCPTGTVPLYRFYNNGYPTKDSNHRYTIDTGVAADMRAKGWTDESVKMCVANNE